MLAAVLYTYVYSGNFNDDKAARPKFHGAYEVTTFIRDKDTIPPLTTDSHRWRRVFVHRRGYVIIQGMDDEMHDYTFEMDTIGKKWFLNEESSGISSEFGYKELPRGGLRITRSDGVLDIELKKIELSQLPVLSAEFNWTIDP
jgi:hypothetical protein